MLLDNKFLSYLIKLLLIYNVIFLYLSNTFLKNAETLIITGVEPRCPIHGTSFRS